MKKHLIFALIALFALLASGCAPAIHSAISHSSLEMDAKLEASVFLTPVAKGKQPTVYVRLTNTSGANADLVTELRSEFAKLGYALVDDPGKADYQVMANLLHMGDAVQGDPFANLQAHGADAALGSSIAALANARPAHILGYGGLAGAVGGVVNFAASKAFEVKTYSGVIDIRIVEQLTGKEHATRLAVTARQTNLDQTEALGLIGKTLAQRTAALFAG